jgi:hypothetical protein
MYRKTNLCVDALTSIGCVLSDTMIFYKSCPTLILYVFYLDLDLTGSNVSRLVVL